MGRTPSFLFCTAFSDHRTGIFVCQVKAQSEIYHVERQGQNKNGGFAYLYMYESKKTG